jgi:hypothetical protein
MGSGTTLRAAKDDSEGRAIFEGFAPLTGRSAKRDAGLPADVAVADAAQPARREREIA